MQWHGMPSQHEVFVFVRLHILFDLRLRDAGCLRYLDSFNARAAQSLDVFALIFRQRFNRCDGHRVRSRHVVVDDRFWLADIDRYVGVIQANVMQLPNLFLFGVRERCVCRRRVGATPFLGRERS